MEECHQTCGSARAVEVLISSERRRLLTVPSVAVLVLRHALRSRQVEISHAKDDTDLRSDARHVIKPRAKDYVRKKQ